jgi:hypothetical protein
VAQANTPALNAAAPTSQPIVYEQRRALDDTANQSQSFYCREISPEQERELEVVLAARPGQTAQIIPQSPAAPVIQTTAAQSTPANQTGDLNITPNAAATTAPSAEPVVQSNVADDHGAANSMKFAGQGQYQQQAAGVPATAAPATGTQAQQLGDRSTKVNNTTVNDNESQQLHPLTQQPAGEAPQAIPQAAARVDLLIVVRRDATPATQPASPAEPISPPLLKSP